MKQQGKLFYQQSVNDVMQQMKANPEGLSDQSVEQRRAQFGYNRLQAKRRTTLFEKFIAQFKD
ncbi:MAG: cation-transporting P-type ATPase, partial [Lentilactobacillus hilgardii]